MDFSLGESAPLLMGILGVALILLIVLFVVGLRMWQTESAARLAPATPAGKSEPAPTMTAPLIAAAAPAIDQPAAATIEVVAVPASPSAPSPADGVIDQLRLLRVEANGALMIEIGGQRYQHPREVRDASHQKILLAALKDFYKFMGQAGLAEKVPDQLTPPPPPPSAPAALTLEEIRAEAHRPLRAPSMNPFQQYKVMREITAVPDIPVLSIAEQIDQVLQANIAASAWVQRGLHVQASPTGEVRFMLDGQSHASLDEVPDPEARMLLQTAIQTWDRGQGK